MASQKQATCRFRIKSSPRNYVLKAKHSGKRGGGGKGLEYLPPHSRLGGVVYLEERNQKELAEKLPKNAHFIIKPVVNEGESEGNFCNLHKLSPAQWIKAKQGDGITLEKHPMKAGETNKILFQISLIHPRCLRLLFSDLWFSCMVCYDLHSPLPQEILYNFNYLGVFKDMISEKILWW